MSCEFHPSEAISSKCMKCNKFLCDQCSQMHENQKHTVEPLPYIIQIAKEKIERELSKINSKITQLDSLVDYDSGEQIIQACLQEITKFINNLFDELKNSYRKICDSLWKNENAVTLSELQKKKQNLAGWKKILKKTPQQTLQFQEEQILQNNKIDSDEQLIQSSRSHLWIQSVPKITFNEIALRRLNQNIGQILSITRTPGKKEEVKKSKYSPEGYVSFSKFLQGTNSLYEYVLNDPQFPQNNENVKKTQFRQFVSPMRCVSLSVGNSIFSIGGHTKEKTPSKEVWIFERSYNTMRVVCLLKKGRVGHTVCYEDDKVYIFGGKGVDSLQQFDIKKKRVEQISFYEKQVVGASSCVLNRNIYVFGGRLFNQIENKNIIKYDIGYKVWQTIVCNNNEFYIPTVSSIVCPVNQNEILVMGGYHEYDGESYVNNHIQVYNVKCNYFSRIGKGQLIYPIQSNGFNYKVKDNKLLGVVELKKYRHCHGPNLPVLFTYDMKQDKMQVSTFM